MQLLRRNPVLRFLLQFWWLPTLASLLFALKSGQPGASWLGLAAYLGLLTGLVGVARSRIAANVARERARHRKCEHRFLCRNCLNTDDFRYGCPNCGGEIDPRIALSGELLGRACPACRHRWGIEKEGTDGLFAYCSHCKTTADLVPAHERKVMIRGAVLAGDFRELAAQSSAAELNAGGVRCIVRDVDQTTEWCLCLEDLAGDQQALSRAHALHGLTELWLSEGDPLHLGKVIDHLISRAEMRDEQLGAIRICVAAAQLDPAAQRLLSSRFGEVRYGISAAEFLKLAAGASAASAAASRTEATRDVAAVGVGHQGGSV